MNPRFLLRAARWARRPPPASRVVLALVVAGLCFALAGLEWVGLLPDWFSTHAPARLP